MKDNCDDNLNAEETGFYLKSNKNPVSSRYTVLMILASLIKWMAVSIIFILWIAIVSMPKEFGFLEYLAIIVPTVLCSIIIYSIGSLISLLIDIEFNQRLQLEKHQLYQEKITAALDRLTV